MSVIREFNRDIISSLIDFNSIELNRNIVSSVIDLDSLIEEKKSQLMRYSEGNNNVPYLDFEIPLYNNNILNLQFANFTNEEKRLYHNLLQLTLETLKKFTTPENNQLSVLSYHFSEGTTDVTTEDLLVFKKLADNYSENYQDSLLSYRELLLKNRKKVGGKLHSKYFENWSYEQIFALLKERLGNLKKCSEDPRKEAYLKKYYTGEFLREKELLEKHPPPSLGEISDTIQWTAASFNSYDTPDFTNNFDKFYQDILRKIGDNLIHIKTLATFLPIDLFDIEDDVVIGINHDTFKSFLQEQGLTHSPFQQFILSFHRDLRSHFSNELYQLFINYSANVDLRNQCKLCDWDIYLNLFMMFIMSYSDKMVFPISFILPDSRSAYNIATNSYSFALAAAYNPKEIFNNSRVLLGLHLIKYSKFIKGQQRIGVLPIYIFKNKEYEDSSPNPDLIYSLYTGELLKYFATDFYLSKVEEGEIISRMNITHQELHDLHRYHGLDIYIIDNNRAHLFLTRKKEETDEALRNLIRKLNMRKVDLALLAKKPTELFRRFKVVDSGTVSPLRLLRKIKEGEDPFFNINASEPVMNEAGEPVVNANGVAVRQHRRLQILPRTLPLDLPPLVRPGDVRVPLGLAARTLPSPPGYAPMHHPRSGGGKKTLKLKAKKNRNTAKKIKTKVIKSKIKKIKTSKKTIKNTKRKN